MQIFRSVRHPGDVPAAVLFGQALAVPVGVCALPVMIGALVVMLQAGRVLSFLTVGFPISLVVAWWWTATRLRSHVAEIVIDGDYVSSRSMWDIAIGRSVRPGSAILDVRRRDGDLQLTVGLDTITLRRSDWPDMARIESLCRAARGEYVRRVQRSIEPR